MPITLKNTTQSKLESPTGPQGQAGAIGPTGATGPTGFSPIVPKITSVQITDNTYTALDDTAVDLTGGYIRITGTGFVTGCQVLVGTSIATSTTFVSSTEIHAQVPAKVAGTYVIYLTNPDGVMAVRANALTYSAMPSWVTASPLAYQIVDQAISIQLNASGATTYTLAAGSSLPSGLTLNSNGLLSGTVTGLIADTTYSFTVIATDDELQDSPKTFNLTVYLIEPFYGLTAYGTTSEATTGTFKPSQSSITVYGCGGGGSGGNGDTLNGYGGGGGGASQLSGYVIATTPGETLSYSVGGPGQATTISRGASVIFQLNGGASAAAGQQAGASGGAANAYSSHAGGAGNSGGSRFNAGLSAESTVGCAGGGGGGGIGDNSPLTAGKAGGSGGSSSISNAIFIGSTGGSGGNYGQVGGDKVKAIGGQRASADVWMGGGGGAGAGIRLVSSASSDLYGGGGGGNGGASTSTINKGGPGLLHITV